MCRPNLISEEMQFSICTRYFQTEFNKKNFNSNLNINTISTEYYFSGCEMSGVPRGIRHLPILQSYAKFPPSIKWGRISDPVGEMSLIYSEWNNDPENTGSVVTVILIQTVSHERPAWNVGLSTPFSIKIIFVIKIKFLGCKYFLY